MNSFVQTSHVCVRSSFWEADDRLVQNTFMADCVQGVLLHLSSSPCQTHHYNEQQPNSRVRTRRAVCDVIETSCYPEIKILLYKGHSDSKTSAFSSLTHSIRFPYHGNFVYNKRRKNGCCVHFLWDAAASELITSPLLLLSINPVCGLTVCRRPISPKVHLKWFPQRLIGFCYF